MDAVIDSPTQPSATARCENCGASLNFAPGTDSLTCAYCRHVNKINATRPQQMMSHPYYEFVARLNAGTQEQLSSLAIRCNSCGATTTLPPAVTSDICPFCTSPLVFDIAAGKLVLKPHYMLPFVVDKHKAEANFHSWLDGLWFAPSNLTGKKVSSTTLTGVYLPHWAYDTNTITGYAGQRGDYYYVTESYVENGQTKTREVKHTRWTSTSGTVYVPFKDVLVSASPSLPQHISSELEPWNADHVTLYDERYFSGFRSETYRLTPEEALQLAKVRMNQGIRHAVNNDIGGDEQRISSVNITYNDLALKYLALPVWLSSYQYNGKLYQFAVNASTGEVIGDRPWSWIKITLAILSGVAVILFFIYQYYAVQ